MGAVPPLFVSHGAPTLALEPGAAGPMLTGLGVQQPRPLAILVVSAHWEAPGPLVSAAVRPKTIHDFYGFPESLYTLRYEAPGAPALAARVAGLLTGAGLRPRISDDRGLDHGAWIPLQYMYPAADIPVTQLTVSPARGAAFHLEVGRALAPLADEAVLVLGSGGITHNLGEFRGQPAEAPAPAWVSEFADWAAAALAAGDADALVHYRQRGPQAARNHPTEEHYLPLLVALGAAGDGARGRRIPGGFSHGVLAMDAFVMDPAAGPRQSSVS
jgi:4,5-DOPA dioxygenase extradiol